MTHDVAETVHGLVLVAHRLDQMQRILCSNLRAEGIGATVAGSARECLEIIHRFPPRAVVLDAEILVDHDDLSAVRGVIQHLAVPVLVLSDQPEHRHTARLLGDAPFCNRPDDVDRVTAAVRGLLAGRGLPSVV